MSPDQLNTFLVRLEETVDCIKVDVTDLKHDVREVKKDGKETKEHAATTNGRVRSLELSRAYMQGAIGVLLVLVTGIGVPVLLATH